MLLMHYACFGMQKRSLSRMLNASFAVNRTPGHPVQHSPKSHAQSFGQGHWTTDSVSAMSCRDEVTLQRLSDSLKMWTTLKKIAEAEVADSTNQAQDSVTRRFLSLAPRVARLNEAVRLGLMSGSCGEAAAEADGAAEAAADEQGAEMGGDARSSEAPPQSPQR